MSAMYPLTLAKMWQGAINATGTVKVQPVNSGYVYSAAHEYGSSITGFTEGTPQTLSSKTYTGGLLGCAAVTVPDVPVADVVAALIFYIDTGSPATSPLLAFIDTKLDSTLISITSVGTNLVISFPNGVAQI